MIYDPVKRALELWQRILEMMSAEEIEAYVKNNSESPMSDAAPPPRRAAPDDDEAATP